MSRHNRKPIVLICMLWVCTSYAARVMDTAESKRSAKGAERQAVQAADQKGLISQNRPLANSIQLKWPEEAQQQEVFSLSFPEVPQEVPPNYAAQLAALYNNNTVVRLSGAGMKRDVAIPLNGTVIITARDPWSPVRGSSPFGVTVAQPAAGGPTAFSYRGDLMCGIYNVGSCGMSGQLLPVQTLGQGVNAGWDALVNAVCNLNSNAGLYCSRLFKSGMRITAEGLASVVFDAAGVVQSIDAAGLDITSIYYIDGPQSLIGELLSAVSTTLGYSGGSLSILADNPSPDGRYRGNATFDLRK